MTKHLTKETFEDLEEMLPSLDSEKKMVEAGSHEHILNLQLAMATTSVNHEYARIEYEETGDMERKEELMYYMTECRDKYDEAREELSVTNPLVLESFEAELARQKQSTMVHYHA